ncbi:helix-turn-helix domain-containing protein [Agromyces sp. NPDC057865]|uniref:helix-turn-helix domain-containing protein n=1 Tax=Agromyces sp. NPDC057865 TaxID=3346267 RepID=UPI003671D2BB
MSGSDPVAQAHLDAEKQSGMYDLFRVGSKMFERPSTRRTLRLAGASAKGIAGCAVRAAYVADDDDRLVRFSGRANRSLDLLVEAREGESGVIDDRGVWRYALFFWGTGKIRGAFVLQSAAEPSNEEMFLLHALAEPTGAALATADLIDRERRHAKELRRLTEAQAGSNRTMAATIARLNAHRNIRDLILAAAGTGNGEAQIVEAVSVITRRPVVLQDSFGVERAFAAVGVSAAPLRLLQPDGEPSTTASTDDPEWSATPIRSRGETLGVIGIHDPDDSLSEDDRFAVEFASEMIAVELAHHRNVAEVEIRLGRDLADDLVAGPRAVDAPARAEALQFDLSGAQRVVLVRWKSPTPNGVDIGAALRHELAAMHVPALISRRSDGMLAVVAGGQDLSELHRRLSTSVSSTQGTIGVGGAHVAEDLADSFAEAGRALRLRVESRRPYGVSNHDDLGLLRVLDTSGDGVELERFVNEWLGRLVEHDRDHRSELVRTLGAYLDSGGNYDRTADELMIHRSTLRYRLGRIRELIGSDFSDPDSRLNLHIAVRIQSALRDNLR